MDAETRRFARRAGFFAAAVGCCIALVQPLMVMPSRAWADMLRHYGVPAGCAFAVAGLLGWRLGPALVSPSGRAWPSALRGILVALAVVLGATLAGVALQLLLEPRERAKGGELVLATVFWVVLVGGLPAVLLGVGAGLAVRADLSRRRRPRTPRIADDA